MTYKDRQRAHRLQFPCFACGYGCDNAPQILNHFLKRHNFDMNSYATHEASPEDLGPQFGCPLCVYWCVGNSDLLVDHYREQHELYLIVDGEDIKEDPKANEKRHQKQMKGKNQEEKGEAAVKQGSEEVQKETASTVETKEEQGSQVASKQKSGEKTKESTPPAEEQKHSPIMQKLMELMDLVKKHDH